MYFTNMLTPCDQKVSDLCRLSVFSCCVINVVSEKEHIHAEFQFFRSEDAMGYICL